MYNGAKKFESAIDWAKWNKEIPLNKTLMKEYNAIEQQAKANSTWMKNADGTPAVIPDGSTPSPELWIQSQSKNWEKAYGKKGLDAVNESYRGVGPTNSDPDFYKGFIEGDKSIFSADSNLADGYAWGLIGEVPILGPNHILGKSGKYHLMHPKNKVVDIDAIMSDWTELNLKDGSSKLNLELSLKQAKDNIKKIKGFEDGLAKTNATKDAKARVNILENYIQNYDNIKTSPEALSELRTRFPGRPSTDDIAAWLPSTDINSVKLRNTIDGGLGDVTIINNKLGSYAKSMLGNNGMFDMTNPNIYKAIVPGAIGAGAVSQMGPKQEDGQFKNGGWLDKYEDGGDVEKAQMGKIITQAQNAGEDVQNAQQDVQNRAVIFAEAPEYRTHQYNIGTPIYDSKGNLIANYPSELETLYNNYNQSEAGIEDINNKKIAEKKASSYLQFLIHERGKMKDQQAAMWKEWEKMHDPKNPAEPNKLLKFEEKYKNLGDQIVQFKKQINKRERDIDKKYNPQLDELYLKNSNAYTDFYNNERNSQINSTDSTFYKEAQNLQRVYEKLQPNTNVEIVPIFRDPDTMREKVADLNKNDAMFLFGHSGSRLGGIPNTEIANIFQESKAENCYLGSCDFEENVEPYTNMVNKNLNYRPSGAWWGVNPNGSTIDEAMWSRVTDPTTGNIDPTVKRTAKIITPTLGVDYQTKKLKTGGWLDKYENGGTIPKAQNGNFGGVNTDVRTTSGESAYDDTVYPGDPNYDTKYKETYEGGAFASMPNQLDEVVISSDVDYNKDIYYDTLTDQEKDLYHNDYSPIGNAVRRKAQTKRGLAEGTYDVVNPLMYGMLGVAGGMMAGPSIANLTRAAAPYVASTARTIGNSPVGVGIRKALNYKPMGGPASLGNMMDAGFADMALRDTPEMYDAFKENPNWDTGTDLALTASDLIPYGEIATGFKGTRRLINSAANKFNDLTSLKPNFTPFERVVENEAGRLKNLFNQPNIYPTSSPLPKRMEPYLSQREIPISKEEELLQSTFDWNDPEKLKHYNDELQSRLIRYNQKGEVIPNFKQGGVIKDDMGQWAHPGEVTEISGNTMATHGYGDNPLYVVPDVGEPRVVEANTGTQTFPGATKFTEYPMAKNGSSLVELNQLTNFTNYNTPQPGGWLDKYN